MRQNKPFPQKPNVLILCEGKTEVKYITSFIECDEDRRRNLKRVTVIYQPKIYSPKGLLEEAKKRIREERGRNGIPFQEVYIVFDKDQHPSIPQTFKEAKEFNPEIKIAYSAICFEYWILLHFESTSTPFLDCDKIMSYIIKNHFPKYHKTDFPFDELKNKIETAKENSRKLRDLKQKDIDNGITKIEEYGSYTDVHLLLEFLENL